MPIDKTALRIGGVYSNGRGRIRVVTDFRHIGAWRDVRYSQYALRSARGAEPARYRPVRNQTGSHEALLCGLHSFAEWVLREATPEEVAMITEKR